MERTLTIVKPDSVANNVAGEVLSYFERAGLRVVAAKMVWLTKRDAEAFYYVHKGKPFYDSLCDFMSGGPCVVAVLEGANAIARVREIMGATDPAKAAAGTIRNKLGTSIQENAVHGSDSAASAEFEIGFFFSRLEIMQTERKG
ncbi:MAG: nucleoside-diphosphate kinase [Candidatus Coatesbacteria bacterium]|nr:MAG: nucleoside-diphosphate kinase [Candidatus Coatesbacteria bacterium]